MKSLGLVYGLVLLAAFAHALWNTIVKRSADRLFMLSAIRAVGLVVGAGAALLVPMPAVSSLPFLAGAVVIHYIYYAFMLNVYRAGDLSQVYPISRGLAPLIVVILAVLIAGEAADLVSAAAVMLIALGIFSLSLSAKRTEPKAILFAVGTGLAIAGYTFLSGLGVRRSGSIVGYAAWLEILTGVGMFAFVWFRRRGAVGDFLRSRWRTGLGAGVLSVGGYFIVLWAMARAPMAPIAALRESSVVFAALFGTFVLRESFGWQRFVSALCVALGILVLGLA